MAAADKAEQGKSGDSKAAPPLMGHGAGRLSAVEVDTYNLGLKDDDGFLGDRACKGAFIEILDDLRKPLKKLKADPLGDTPTAELGRKELDAALTGGDPDAVGLMQGAVEAFAQELAFVAGRFLKSKGWRETERIVVGGGLSDSKYGQLAVARAGVLIKGEGIKIDLQPIRNHPDEAGLIGAVHLAPPWIFEAHDSILAVDIGGTNIRAGVLDINLKKARDLSKVQVWKRDLWRHADDKPSRTETIERLCTMLTKLIRQAEKEGFKLAPFIGIGCPGAIEADGSIAEGAQNLPGNWESQRFNLPRALIEAVPTIGDHETVVLMHNDAVVQGLSEVPFMRDVERWGVLTIGTGLGNARFTNRTSNDKEKQKK
jgi:hypothetical protein